MRRFSPNAPLACSTVSSSNCGLDRGVADPIAAHRSRVLGVGAIRPMIRALTGRQSGILASNNDLAAVRRAFGGHDHVSLPKEHRRRVLSSGGPMVARPWRYIRVVVEGRLMPPPDPRGPRCLLATFREVCLAGERTVSTGQPAVCTTRSAMLPMKTCENPVRPCVPRMIRSAEPSRAFSTIAAAAVPSTMMLRARTPRLPRRATSRARLSRAVLFCASTTEATAPALRMSPLEYRGSTTKSKTSSA